MQLNSFISTGRNIQYFVELLGNIFFERAFKGPLLGYTRRAYLCGVQPLTSCFLISFTFKHISASFFQIILLSFLSLPQPLRS
jgi:hypothetical protein